MSLKFKIQMKFYRSLYTFYQVIGRIAWKTAEWCGRQSGKMCEKMVEVDNFADFNISAIYNAENPVD